MLTRRIVISACALSLAIPVAAGASPATDPPKARAPDGITPTTYPMLVKAKRPLRHDHRHQHAAHHRDHGAPGRHLRPRRREQLAHGRRL
jgi:hypothetical protein